MSNNTKFSPNNGTVFTIVKIIKAVISLAAEAELGSMFIKFKEAILERQAMEEVGNKQTPTPMQIDNTTAHVVVTNSIYSKRIKSMDMRLYWLRCRATQGKYRQYWISGATNLGDYVTKHHASIHH